MSQLLKNKEWVEHQFNHALRPWMRDVLVHASFIEATVRIECLEAKKKNLNYGAARKELGKDSHYSEELVHIDCLRKKRDELVHEIITEKIDEDKIIERIHEMHNLIKLIYEHSPLVNRILSKKYGFDCKAKMISFKLISET